MKRLKLFFACLLMAVLSIGQMWADVADALTASDFAATSTNYTDFSGVTVTSDAVYAGNSAKDASGNIQLRSKNSNSGIVSTTSGGTVKSVKITVGSGTNTVDVYGSNTAYTAASNLYNSSTQGTKVGSLSATGTITFTDEYAYVGIRSNNGALYLSEVEITWTSAAPPTYTITAESNNTTCGTVSLSGSVITGSPKSGCRYASPAYTVLSGNAEVAQNGNAFTVTPSSDCTIQINFEEIPSYIVTWNNNGVTSTTQVLEGEKPVFPATPASCDATSTTFIGWAVNSWSGKVATPAVTVYTKAADMPAVSAAVTYYAVFAKSSGSSAFDGEHGGTFKIYAQVGEDKYYASGTVVSSKINSTDDAAEAADFEIEAVTGGFTIKSGTNYITYAGSSTNLGTSTDEYVWTIEEGTHGSWRVNSGTSGRALIYRAGTTNKFGGYSTGNVNGTEYFDVEIEGAASLSDYMTTCCTKYNVNIAAGIENGSVSADPTSACEGATVTLTFTPAGGYHLDSWSVNSVAQDINDNTFTMPDEAVTVSATFVHDDCSNLLAPTLDGVTKTYNSATIAWNTVTDAVAYAVSVVKDGESEPVFSGNVDALSKALENLEPETQYNYTIMAIGDGTVKCADGNGLLEGNFTTNPLPTAHLTLMNLGAEHASSGDYVILTPFNLPTTAATCSKAFVGWDADADCAVAPTYAKGESFQFNDENDVTLYAVYADVTGGGASSVEFNAETYAGANGWEDAKAYTTFTINGVTFTATGGANDGKYYTSDKTWRLYNGGSLSISATGVTISSVSSNPSVSFAEDNGIFSCSFTATTKFKSITVNVAAPETYENYSTACIAAPEAIVDPEELNVAAAGVANGVIEAAYDNVNEEEVGVSLWNNQACTEAFEGSWLTASINDDKNIAYTIAENTTYAARTAYIKLTAPAAVTGPAPAEVVIPVSQEGKAKVFASLAELVAAEIPSGEEVTVTFDEVITGFYTNSQSKKKGIYLTTKAANDKAIEIYYNQGDEVVPSTWVAGGKASATAKVYTWTYYTGGTQWELVPNGTDRTWTGDDFVTYTAPKAVSSVVVSGTPDKTTYVDGEKFDPAGLTVTVYYNDETNEVDPVGVTFACDPVRVAKSESPVSVNVVATFNEIDSDPFEVTGLTVGDIQLKTVAQFIEAGNADMRCYLEGIVSDIETGTKLKYGNFNLTDASGTIYVYGCLNQAGEAQKFDELGVQNGDKIKVIAEDYEFYSSKDEAKNVQFVSKISPVQITIADKVLEEGANWTIVATTDPEGALANISYEIKDDGSDAFISLAGNVITANAAGTATIIASIPDGEGYLANSIEFEVEVVEAGSVANVVILVEYEGAWYAMKHDKSGVLVDYQPAIGKIYGMTDPDEQAEIVWTRSKTGTTYTFTTGNKYIKGANSGTSLSVETGETGKYQWEKGAEETYYHCTTGRTFFYNGTDFKNYAIGNAGTSGYSSLPKVELSDDIFTSNTIYTRTVSGNYGTICLPKAGVLTNGALYEISYYDADQKKIFFDEVEGGVMVAGAPYIFKPNENVTELKVAYTDATVVENAGHKNGLYGHYDLNNPTEGAEAARLFLTNGDYFLRNNEYWLVDQEDRVYVDNYRAYIKLDKIGNDVPPQAYGRRRVAMNVNGEQVATGFENLNASEKPVKLMIDGNIYILRGEKLYDTTGRLVK